MKIGDIITVAADEFLGTAETRAEVVEIFERTADVRCLDDGELCPVWLTPNSVGAYEIAVEPRWVRRG